MNPILWKLGVTHDLAMVDGSLERP